MGRFYNMINRKHKKGLKKHAWYIRQLYLWLILNKKYEELQVRNVLIQFVHNIHN